MVFWATCLATEILDIIEATEATTEAGAEEATVEASPGREDHGPGDPGPHLPPRGPGLLQDSEAPGEDENYTTVVIKCVCVICKLNVFKEKINYLNFGNCFVVERFATSMPSI